MIHLTQPGTLFQDQYVTRASELLQKWQGEGVHSYGLIGVPLAKTSISHSGAHLAPAAFRQSLSGFTTYAAESGCDLQRERIIDFGDIAMHATDVIESHKRIKDTLYELLQKNEKLFPIIIGGDHSVSYPAIAAFQQARGKTAVIQFDAHCDVRNLHDGGVTNGTPFRKLLEEKHIEGDYLYQVGIRNFVNSEAYIHYVKQAGVRMVTMEHVTAVGIQNVMQNILHEVEQKADHLYVSLDMDVLDQAYAPGCPAAAPGGMSSSVLIEALSLIARSPLFSGIDLVEVDPTVDFRSMTSKLSAYMVLSVLEKRIR
ncbi:formimidoylglutamase [Priestia koreensis]|uniref:formimidoylglutamase n=1 Tax=Priestia koreensis TaxID=284581 RepID=UPI003457C4A0